LAGSRKIRSPFELIQTMGKTHKKSLLLRLKIIRYSPFFSQAIVIVVPRIALRHTCDRPNVKLLKNSYILRAARQSSINVVTAKSVFGVHTARTGFNVPAFTKLSAPVIRI